MSTLGAIATRLASQRGASLIEAIVASAVVVTVIAGVAHLAVWSRRAVFSAGTRSSAASLAVQKMELLQSLAWHVATDGSAVSDETTDASHDPPRPGGPGLTESPAGTLERNTPQYVDYLDPHGRWCGTGASAPPAAAFVRRWAIEPFPGDERDTIRVIVAVEPIAHAATSGGRGPGIVRLQTIRTRVAP